MKTYLTVCKQTVYRNLKLSKEKQKPPLRISVGKHGKPYYKWRMFIPARPTVVYDPENPLPWGARAWIEWGE